MTRTRVELATDRIKRTRQYTEQFLAGLSSDEWFWSPAEYTTHIAWQVAHVAVSQYRLCLQRVRGRITTDDAFLTDAFVQQFMLGSQPAAGAENNPPVEEIRRVFDNVQKQILRELAERTDDELDVPADPPHPAFDTKLGGVEYSAYHEMVHTGQIGMLRRMMGKAAIR